MMCTTHHVEHGVVEGCPLCRLESAANANAKAPLLPPGTAFSVATMGSKGAIAQMALDAAAARTLKEGAKAMTPICPECDMAIDHLDVLEPKFRRDHYYYNHGKLRHVKGQMEDNPPMGFGDEVAYVCPECGQTLAEDDAEAIKFLTPRG